ncbi:MAG: pyruvate kinase [Lactobacillaceae bacterium]|jgi:pyruvate kinase|nr:pyruvate kinase [Lactobacillaceae bacterium]
MPKKTHANILATLGPSSSTKEQIEKLIDAGADGVRFNFSHGSHEEHKERYNIVRKLEKEKGKYISILADMQGPKLRVGKFRDESVYIKEGDYFTLDMKDELGDATRVKLPHPEIFHALKVGDELLVNDGKIVLTVDECDEKHAKTIVTVGGYISSNKGVNLPNTQLNISAITEKDEKDLKFALKLGVDWIGLSFVQSADDVRRAKEIIGDKAWIITKLEKPSAIDDLDEIVRLSDAIMIARGDLGVECPLQKVPVLQKKIVSVCRRFAKPVIVATQMLESMITSPMPTRAEVSDVANAIYEGADTVMLSAETAAGQYPEEAVKMMKKIIVEVESDKLYYDIMVNTRNQPKCMTEADAITFAATEISDVLRNVSAIVTYTSSGKTTLLAARERPSQTIIAITPNIEVARRMALVWGTECHINKDPFKSFDKVQSTAIETVTENNYAKSGDFIIITAGIPFNKSGITNMVQTLLIP